MLRTCVVFRAAVSLLLQLLEDRDSELAALESRLDAEISASAVKSKEISQLQAEMNRLQVTHAAEMDGLRYAVASSRETASAEARAALQASQTEIASLTAEISRLKSELLEKSAALRSCQAARSDQDEQLAECRRELDAMQVQMRISTYLCAP